MKAPRSILTVSTLTFGATILLAGVWVQSAASAGRGGGRGGRKVPHTVQFSGDIQSSPFTVNLDPDNPFGGRLKLDGFEVTFPTITAGTSCGCIVTDPDCSDPFVDGWGGYGLPANNPWTGPMRIRKGNVFFNEGTNDVGGNQMKIIPNEIRTQGTPQRCMKAEIDRSRWSKSPESVMSLPSPF